MANKNEEREEELKEWAPTTKAGKLVQRGEIDSLEEIRKKNLPLVEPEIITFLYPNLEEEVLDVKRVQRTTDAGRKMSFLSTVCIGDKENHVGLGKGKGTNVRPAIENATREAKTNLISVKKGCGSWECGCDEPHSIPFQTEGKEASTRIVLIPAPKGTGIVAGETQKKVLELAGIKDIWTRSLGTTRTTFNSAYATLKALRKTKGVKK